MGKLTDKYADAVYQATQKPKVVSPALNPYNQQPINQVQSTVKPLTSVVSKSVPQVTQAVKSFVTAPLDVTGAKKADQADLSKSATYFGEAGIVQPLKSVARTVQAIPSAITLGTSIKPEERKDTVTIAGTKISTETQTYDPYNQSEQYRNIKSSLETQYGSYENMPENTKAIYENVVNSVLTVDNFGKTFEEQITNIQNEYADKPIPSFMQEKLDVLQDQQIEYTAKVDNARQKLIDLQNQNIQELTDIQEKYQDVQLLTGTEYASKVSSTIIQMTPYILASYAGGGIGGAVLGSTLGSTAMYATVYTNASAQALQEGATDEQANTYAHMSALIETGTEALFGGVVGAPKGILSEGVAGMIEKGLLKSTTNGTAQILIKKAVDVFGEGAEEYLAEYLGSMAMSIYTQDERSLQELNQDAIDSFIMGAITSGVMQVGRVGAVRAIESLVTDKQVDVENIPLQQANEVMNAIVTRAGVATREGLAYRVENLPANEKGYYDASTREIVLNKKEVDQYGLIDTALPHEMTHALEGTKAYQEMANFILQSKQEEFDVTIQELRELYQAKFDKVHEQQLALGNTNHTLEIATNETMAREMIAEYIRNNFASRPMKDAQGNIMRDSNGQIILYRDYNALLDLAKKPTIVSALKKTLQNYVLKSKLADAEGTSKEAFLQAQAYFESLDTFLSNALKNAPTQQQVEGQPQIAYQLTQEQQDFFKDSKARDEEGNLIPVYHGSDNYFTTPLEKKVYGDYKFGNENVMFFTDNLDVAKSYQQIKGNDKIVDFKNARGGKETFGGYIYSGYLNIKNPLVIDAKNKNWNTIEPFDVKELLTSNKTTNEDIELYKELNSLYIEGIEKVDDYKKQKLETIISNIENNIDLFNSKDKIVLSNQLTKIKEQLSIINKLGYFQILKETKTFDKAVEILNDPFNKIELILDKYELNDELYVVYGYSKDIRFSMYNNSIKVFNNDVETNDIIKAVLNVNKKIDNKYDSIIFKNVTDAGGYVQEEIDKIGKEKYKEKYSSTVFATIGESKFKDYQNLAPTLSPDIRYSLDLNKNILSENNDNGIRVINEYETDERKFNDTLESAQDLLKFSDNKGYGYNSVQYGDEVYTKDTQIDNNKIKYSLVTTREQSMFLDKIFRVDVNKKDDLYFVNVINKYGDAELISTLDRNQLTKYFGFNNANIIDSKVSEGIKSINRDELNIPSIIITDKVINDIQNKSKEKYGTTTSFAEGGFMTTDGTLLDFSGKEDSGISNVRYIDHREFNMNGFNWLDAIDKLGFIRMQPESNSINLTQPLTDAQKKKLKSYIEVYSREAEFTVDVDSDWKTYKAGTRANVIFNDLDTYFKTGILPKNKLQYSLTFDRSGNLTTSQQEKDFTVRENGQLKVFYYNQNGISQNALNYGYFLNESSQGLDNVKQVYVNANVVDANGMELQSMDLSKYDITSDMTNAEIIKSVGDKFGIEEVTNLLNEITQSTGINALQFDNALMVFNKDQYSNVPNREFRDDVSKIEYKKVGNKYQINEYNEYNDLIHSELMTQDEVIENVGQFAEKVLTNATNKFNVSDAKPDNSKVTTQQVEFLSDSAIKNEDGSPKHVYHGSPNVFESFSYQNMGRTGLVDGVGFYFTDNKEFASGFSGETGKVYDVFLNIKKPTDETSLTITKEQLKEIMLDIDSKFDGDFLNNYDDVSRLGKEKVLNSAVNLILENYKNDKDIINGLMDNVFYNRNTYEPILRSVMDKTGIDGVIVNKDYGTLYIPFVPEQIVSTTNPIPQAEPTTEKIAYNNSINQVTITDTPTQAEYKALESYFNSASLRDGSNIYVNLSSLNGAVDGKSYGIETTGQQIIKDIKYFYNNDRLPSRQYSLEQEREATRSYQNTVMQSNILNTKDKELLYKDVEEGKYTYTVIGDDGAVQRANSRISQFGVDTEYSNLKSKFETNQRFTKDDEVTSQLVLNKLSAQGRVSEWQDLVTMMAVLHTESGQFNQAVSIVKRLDAEGQYITLTKSVDKMNRRFSESKKQKKPVYIPQKYTDYFVELQGKQVELIEQRKQFEQQQIELENTQREIDSLVLSGVGEELGTLQNELNELRDLQKEQNALERKLVLLNEKLSMYSNENIEFLESDVQEIKARVNEYQSRLNEINKNIKRFNELETILESISGVSQRDLNAIKNKYQNITQSNKAYAKLFGKLEGLTGVDVAKINEMKASVKELEKAQRSLQKLIDKNANYTSQDKIDDAMDEVKYEIAQQLEADAWDKVNAWRYLSMLGNPKTHFRNILGNTAMLPLVFGKNVVAQIVEMSLPQEQRTKSIIISKEMRDFALKDFKDNIDAILGNGKYSITGEIVKNKRIFKNRILENLRNFNFDLLGKEDEFFQRIHYVGALAGYLTAQKVDLNNISEETLNKARQYASNEAKKATFNDMSILAEKLSRIEAEASNRGTVGGRVQAMAMSAVIPFKKVPINIAKRGIEYSPIGLFKTVAQEVYNLKTGKTTNATEFIDNLSAGLTGTGIAVMGLAAYLMGVIEVGADDDEEKRLSYLESAMGRQRYSINVLGGSYTIDWLSPAVMPFIVGAEIAQTVFSENGGTWTNATTSALANILDPLFELTMMQGVTKTLSSFSGSGVAMAGEATQEMIANYAAQFIPTMLGQIARIIDPIQRSTLSDKKDFDKWLEQTVRKIANKIPFATFLNAPVVNVKGEIISSSENPFIRAFNNMVNPGYYKEKNVNSIDNEIMKLYDLTLDANVLPKIQRTYYTVNGENVYLTNEQYSKSQQTMGKTSYELLRELVGDPEYYSMSNTTKANIIADIYEQAYQTAKDEALGGNTDSTYIKVLNAEKIGIKPVEYLLIKDYVATIREDDNSDNKGQFIDYLIRQGYLSKKNELLEMFGWKADSIEINGLESIKKLTDTIQIEGLKKLD